MSAEYIADKVAEVIADETGWDVSHTTQDVLSGGWFFEIERNGKEYEVLVQEVRRG